VSDQDAAAAEQRAALVRGLMRELHEARAAKDRPAIDALVAALNTIDDGEARSWRAAFTADEAQP